MIFHQKDVYKGKFGIYMIKNVNNDRFYIGSTTNQFYQRFATHKSSLRKKRGDKGQHGNTFMFNDYKTHGNFFVFTVLEIVEDKSKVIQREQFYLDQAFVGKNKLCYNARSIATDTRTSSHSSERKAHQSKSMKEKWADDEWRRMYMDNHIPRKLSAKEIDAIKVRNSLRVRTKEETEKRIKNMPTKRSVMCIETGKVYLSVSSCAKDMNLVRRCVGRVCAGTQTHTMGYHFKFSK